MDSAPFFTIITVNLNNLRGLAETGDSVLQQVFPDFEWLVIDGGSTDGSVAHLGRISDSRLKYVSARDSGIYDAMNSGLDLSRGRYVVFMNAGDRFADGGVLGDVALFANAHNVSLIYGNAIEAGHGPVSTKRALPHWMVFYSMFTHHQAMFYQRSAIGTDRYDLSYFLTADWVFTARMLKRGLRARHIKRDICIFERGGVSQLPESVAAAERELRRLHEEVLSTPRALRVPVIEAKLLINKLRRRWPGLYRVIRSRW